MPIFAAIFLSRFAFAFAGRKLSLPLLVIVASIVGLAAFGRLRVHLPRLILFAVSIGAMMTAAALGGSGRVSAMSFLLLAVLYLAYVFVVDSDEATYAWIIVAFRRLCLVAAIAGIAQFFAQLILPGPTLFTFRGFVPDSYLALEYNYVDPVGFLPGFFKSNGFFLPEPSIFGQLMALAAISEVLFFGSSYRLFVIALALFLSFSGSGAILCLVFIPLLLLRRGNPSLLLLAAGLALVLFVFSDSHYLEPFIGRMGEFQSTHSSAFARFLSPFYLFNDFVFTSTRNTLLGLGPGAIDSFFNNFYTEVFDPTWGKLFFEYGLVGALPFALFITCCFFADAPAKWLSGALFLNYLLFGGYLLSAPVTGLVLALTVWHRAPRRLPVAAIRDARLPFVGRPAGGSGMTEAVVQPSLVPRRSARGAEELRIALVDPSLFTIPYDAKLAHALGGLGHEVTVYGEARGPGEAPTEFARLRPLFYPELLHFGMRHWARPAQRLAKGALHWRAMRRLVDDLHATKPDIIHFQWAPLPVVDRLFVRTLRRMAPIVLTAHDSRPFNGAAWRLQKWGATSILNKFDGVIVHTDEARDRLADYGVPLHRLARIPHGLLHDTGPLTAPAPRPSDRVRFLLFGKLKPYKGADLLIEAFRRLPPDLQARVEVRIVGKPYMDVTPLTETAKPLGEGIRLDFRFVPDAEMNDLLAQSDVIVFPYREIDVSGVLMAALRHARPIIASRIGGFAELLVDGRHGLLVPPGDAAALAAAMTRLCSEPRTRSAMGAAVGQLGAAIPSWDEIARRTTELYRSLLGSG